MTHKYQLIATDIKTKKFQINQVAKVDMSTQSIIKLPMKNEIAIEKINPDNSCYVVAMLKWDNKNHDVQFHDVCMRSVRILENISKQDLDEYLNCINIAEQKLFALNASKNINEEDLNKYPNYLVHSN